MKTALRSLLVTLASLRLTVVCLSTALVLVLVGTLAQVNLNPVEVQRLYFQSWFIWWSAPSGGFSLPVFPGGHFIGAVLLLNLMGAHISRFVWSWRKAGIQLTHLGLIIMLAGGLATDLFSVSSHMYLRQGETKNYSDDDARTELAVTELTLGETNPVIAIPGEVLAACGSTSHVTLPFKVVVKGFYPNADLQMLGQENGPSIPAASNGAGAQVGLKPLPPVSDMNKRNQTCALVEIIPNKDGKSLGTWLVSVAIDQAQDFEVDGRRWSLELRFARYYKDYSLSLISFTHEIYPGTEIPKNFSSKVTLADAQHHEARQVQIYMNHPLRYLGDTYYQSGFQSDNSGTILQVVRNPSYQAPYISCIIVSLGLLMQFTYHLVGFARRTNAASAP
ncbi:MAG: cytochrome c biogenesis protein ResB [Verrucomicrobia bacterium]|nr:MAG: cytochrome c biogenesis protein ResB [Verrucomicrobiota bacterium]